MIFRGPGYRRTTNANAAILAGLLLIPVTGVGPSIASTQTDPPQTMAPASSKDKSDGEPIKFALKLVRTDTANATDTVGTATIIGTPTITTLDGKSASLSVTGDDLSYMIAFTPKIEQKAKMVQILWNIRISGKSLPGATGITMTGASRVPLVNDAGIAELSVSDPATGRKSVFRLQGATTTGDAAGTLPPTP